MGSIRFAQLEEEGPGKGQRMEKLGVFFGGLGIAIGGNAAPNQIVECFPQLDKLNLKLN